MTWQEEEDLRKRQNAACMYLVQRSIEKHGLDKGLDIYRRLFWGKAFIKDPELCRDLDRLEEKVKEHGLV